MLPLILVKDLQLILFCYILNRVRHWIKNERISKPKVIWEPPIEPNLKDKLFSMGEYKLKDNERVMTVNKGFCQLHPDETRLVLGPKVNDCYQCLRVGNNKKRR